MGRKNNSKSDLSKSKKDKAVFKVTDTKAKKPKAVIEKLKNIKEDIKTKGEKVDVNLKELHKGLVVKKPKVPKPTTSAAVKSPKKPTGNVKAASGKMEKLEVSTNPAPPE